MYNKLLLFDLDDTLLTSKKTISLCTSAAIKACKEKGMLIGYITARARPFRGEAFFIDNLPCDFIAYYNGAEICAGDKTIESNLIPYKDAISIIQKLSEAYPKTAIGVYLEPWSYMRGEIWNIDTGEKQKCSLFDLPHYDVQRMRIVFDADDDIQLNDYLTEEAVSFLTSDGTAIIINKNAVKERALKKASEWFQIPLCDIIAFGDDVNDIAMLKMAGTGVAMGNAADSVKAAADYITESNDDEGICNWINNNLFHM